MTPRLRSFLILAGVLLITALAFSPSLFNGFLKNDDPGHLLENPAVRALSLENFRAMFLQIINTTYVPLTTVSFAVEYYFFGYNPFVYHLDNLLLHLAVVACVFYFLQKLGCSLPAAGLGSLIFGVHPMHVESVAWVTERKDVLYALFYMGSLLLYLRYASSGRRIFYWLSIGLCLLSILSKAMALSLPLVLLLCDWWMGRKWSKKILFEKILYFVIVIAIAGITYAYNARVPWHSSGQALMLWMWCFVFYLRKFFFPAELITFYQFPTPLAWTNGEFFFSAFIFVALMAAVFYFRRNKLLIFAILFYSVSIFFLLRFDDVENINPVSDRFMYLPCVGFCMLLGIGIISFVRSKKYPGFQRKAVIAATVIGVIALSAKTFDQCRAWGDGVVLWSAVIKSSPNLPLAYVHRGTAYHEKRDLVSASEDYKKAISLKDDAYAHSNLAMIYKEARRFDDALSEYQKAIVLKPEFWGAYFDRGNLYRETGHYDLAVVDYTKVLQILPGYAEAYANRGTAHFLNGEDLKALYDFNRAVRFNPREINAINNRAVIYAKQGKFENAIKDFSLSIALDPVNPAVYFNRGLAYSQNEQMDLAVADFDRTLKIDPNYREAYNQKMNILRTKGMR